MVGVKWWLCQFRPRGKWAAKQIFTLFNLPLFSYRCKVIGPFAEQSQARLEAERRNAQGM